MATQTKGSKANGAKPTAKAPAAEKNQARVVAETAVDLPVGAVLTVTERVTELVEPFTDRSAAGKQLKSYRDRDSSPHQTHRAPRRHCSPPGNQRGAQDPQPGRA